MNKKATPNPITRASLLFNIHPIIFPITSKNYVESEEFKNLMVGIFYSYEVVLIISWLKIFY